MRLDASVDLEPIAADTAGASGADLKGICAAAGRNALLRELETPGAAPAVTMDDFTEARHELVPNAEWSADTGRIGFLPTLPSNGGK